MTHSSIYFRVLYSEEHYDRWNSDPPANSSHHRPPVAWIKTWQETKKTDDLDKNYPLSCEDGGENVRFTSSARQTFLANPGKDYSKCLESSETYAVGELDGVCAFSTAEACLAWILNNPRFKRDSNNVDFVAFVGVRTGYDPEDQGVVAKVIKKEGGLMKLEQFKRLYIK